MYYEPQEDGPARRVYGKRTFEDLEEAKAFRISKDAEIHGTGRAARADAGKESVAEWAERWWQSRQTTKKPTTLAGDRRTLDSSVIPILGTRQIRSISPADVDDFIQKVARGGGGKRSSASIRHHYGVLRQVLKYAHRREAIPTNPALGAEIPADRHDRLPFEPVALSESQIQDLAEAMRALAPDTPYALLIEFMAYTGLRAGEVAGLTIADIKLPVGQVHVRQTRQKHKCTAPPNPRTPDNPKGRGRACTDDECCWTISTPKNRKPRVVDIPTDWLCEDLAAYLADHPHGPNGDNHSHAPLWPGRSRNDLARFQGATGGLDWNRSWWRDGFYQRQFKPAVKLAGLPESLRLHDLRHTAGSLMLDKGMQPVEVARQLGHSLYVFMTIYAHQIGSDPKATRARFDSTRPAKTPSLGVTAGENVTALHKHA
ncbi:tyrosine-type recombinase/integrase [Nocardioides sp.]|uniref:tyrosine-type recombinase/integrase n=1 Tax=Nocardioides sp. TaxID=35761 RepID=UPI0037842A09